MSCEDCGVPVEEGGCCARCGRATTLPLALKGDLHAGLASAAGVLGALAVIWGMLEFDGRPAAGPLAFFGGLTALWEAFQVLRRQPILVVAQAGLSSPAGTLQYDKVSEVIIEALPPKLPLLDGTTLRLRIRTDEGTPLELYEPGCTSAQAERLAAALRAARPSLKIEVRNALE